MVWKEELVGRNSDEPPHVPKLLQLLAHLLCATLQALVDCTALGQIRDALEDHCLRSVLVGSLSQIRQCTLPCLPRLSMFVEERLRGTRKTRYVHAYDALEEDTCAWPLYPFTVTISWDVFCGCCGICEDRRPAVVPFEHCQLLMAFLLSTS